MSQLSISVMILDRSYRLHVTKETEEYVRRAAKLIEESSNKYSQMYAYKDRQDLLAMVALEKITSLVQIEEQLKFQETGFMAKLQEINHILEDSNLSPDLKNR